MIISPVFLLNIFGMFFLRFFSWGNENFVRNLFLYAGQTKHWPGERILAIQTLTWWEDPGQTKHWPEWDDPGETKHWPGWDDPGQTKHWPGWDDPGQTKHWPAWWEDPWQIFYSPDGRIYRGGGAGEGEGKPGLDNTIWYRKGEKEE